MTGWETPTKTLGRKRGKTKTGAPSAERQPWDVIDWRGMERAVQRLQIRIAKATREGRYGKVKALQWLLTHSHAAKLLAVRRVTQNRGKETPGIDGEVWRTTRKKWKAAQNIKRRGYHPQPLRRIYINKKNGKQRPLSIPCMIDRAHQALHLLALEPVSETLVDKNTYGFRPRRSVADAIEQCFLALCKKCSAQWVLEGDIKSCFDEISHAWMLENIAMDTNILQKWLKMGYLDKGAFHETKQGVAQGGVISPTLMLMTLRGLEGAAKAAAPRKAEKVNVIAYADDFVITGATKEVLENKIKPVVKAFLAERGLELSEEKTRITHIHEGFDFLGFNIRKYKHKLLIKPVKKNVLAFVENLKGIIRKGRAMKTEALIGMLNSRLTGWANYYRHGVSKKAFSFVDYQVFQTLWKWAKRRHNRKGKKWIINKYYDTEPGKSWTFKAKRKSATGEIKPVALRRISEVEIRRHIKIRAEANPYDPNYAEYFVKRKRRIREKQNDTNLPMF